jgi:hypothetical protein
MSKWWQYVINDVKVCGGVEEVSINDYAPQLLEGLKCESK